jgi:hypothetical protein
MAWNSTHRQRLVIVSGLKRLFVVVAVCLCNKANSQIELLGFAGTSQYSGDLGGASTGKSTDLSELNFASTRFHLGGGIRFYANSYWAFRGNLFFAKISGDDKYTDDVNRRNRNLNFFSPLFGINAMAEFHFGFGGIQRFYLLGGAEYFSFNPKTKYQGDVVELQPLGTEGQYFLQDRAPYELTSAALVAGGGVNIFYTPAGGSLSLEITGHKTFTDYLDDVSTTYVDKAALLNSNGQMAVDLSDRNLGYVPGATTPGQIRGNPGHKDNFVFISLCYSHDIGGKKHRAAYQQRGARQRGVKSRCFEF